jgi:hypothetical protein
MGHAFSGSGLSGNQGWTAKSGTIGCECMEVEGHAGESLRVGAGLLRVLSATGGYGSDGACEGGEEAFSRWIMEPLRNDVPCSETV